MHRRLVLRCSAAAASGLLLPGTSFARARFDAFPFALGVASGSPQPHSVVLWTRIAPGALVAGSTQAIRVGWQVADDESFGRVVQSGQSYAYAELGHSVHIDVQGLQPDRWYFYRFQSGDSVSRVGRTRTLPLATSAVQRLRLGYASCQKWEDGYFSSWRHMREENLEAVLFLGDYIYEYPGRSSKVRVPTGGWVLTLDDYRARYALYKSDPDLQAMHAACPWLLTWDDHEVENDYAGQQGGDSRVPVEDFPARRAAAYQAYYENMPLRFSVLTRAFAGLGQGAELRLFGRLQFGQLANLYLLDCRQYRDPQICTKDERKGSSTVDPRRCDAWRRPRSMLGMEQEAWLQQELSSPAGRGAVWNVLGQSTLLGKRNLSQTPAQRYWNDGWDGYAAARTRMTMALQQSAAANPVVLGGDVHENWVGHVKADYDRPESPAIGVEFCGTSITSKANPTDSTPLRLSENPHFVFADSTSRGYGVVEFTPEKLTTTLRGLEDVTRADSGVSTLARFHVGAGRPVIEKYR